MKGLRQLISESREVHVGSSSEDEQANNDDICCRATFALSSQIGECLFRVGQKSKSQLYTFPGDVKFSKIGQ